MTIQLIDRSTVELHKHNAADDDVAYAAWVSNFAAKAREKDTGRIGGLISFLYNNKHMSPFEHGSFTFFIDSPIFVAREFMRHRTFSYNETSGRYKELEPRFYLPRKDRPLVQVGKIGSYSFTQGTDEQFNLVDDLHKEVFETAWSAYQDQLSQGIAKEVARNVLPLATMTQFYATANPRNVMAFLALRDDVHALDEIRAVARTIDVEFQKAMPLTHKAYADNRRTLQKLNRLLDLLDTEEDLDQLIENLEAK